MQTLTDSDIIDGYYTLPAACFVRDHLRVSSADPPALVRKGLEVLNHLICVAIIRQKEGH